MGLLEFFSNPLLEPLRVRFDQGSQEVRLDVAPILELFPVEWQAREAHTGQLMWKSFFGWNVIQSLPDNAHVGDALSFCASVYPSAHLAQVLVSAFERSIMATVAIHSATDTDWAHPYEMAPEKNFVRIGLRGRKKQIFEYDDASADRRAKSVNWRGNLERTQGNATRMAEVLRR